MNNSATAKLFCTCSLPEETLTEGSVHLGGRGRAMECVRAVPLAATDRCEHGRELPIDSRRESKVKMPMPPALRHVQ